MSTSARPATSPDPAAIRATDLPQPQRVAKRVKVFRPIALQMSGGIHKAHVLDLSATGARLHADCPHRAWSSVTLHCEDLDVSGRVVWTKGLVFGVKFLRTLSEAEIDLLVDGR